MPQLIVVTDSPQSSGEVVYRERIASTDLESAHFSGQLVERVGWAVRDAGELERPDPRARPRLRPAPAPPRVPRVPSV